MGKKEAQSEELCRDAVQKVGKNGEWTMRRFVVLF